MKYKFNNSSNNRNRFNRKWKYNLKKKIYIKTGCILINNHIIILEYRMILI